MSTTVSAVQTLTNQYLRDTSTNSVTAADRLAAITEATQEMMAEFGFDQTINTYTLSYFDTVNYYNITTAVPGILEPTDLRKKEGTNDVQFTRKNPRVLSTDIANNFSERAFGVERRNGKIYLVINYTSPYQAYEVHSCDSLSSNGTWAVDSTNSDATNLTLDTVEYKEGNGSLNFDITVSQSTNNRATLTNTDLTSVDLHEHENLSSFVYWIYVPDVTYFTSTTLYIGSNSTNYWSASATTDITGAAWANEWNRVKINWADMTATGSPTSVAITYLRVDYNYSASQTDDTDYRLDDIKLIRPDKLDLYYQSNYVGTTSTAVSLITFGATTDIPFYSGQYDNFNNPIAHKAASILFYEMGDMNSAQIEDSKYQLEVNKLKRRFPASTLHEEQNFKVKGVSFVKNKF